MNIKNILGKDLKEFLSQGKNYVTGDIFAKGIAFLSIPIFTRLLTPSEYGVVAVFASYVALFTIISGLGLRGAVARYFYEKTNDFDKYFGSILSFILAWSCIIFALLYLLRIQIATFFNLPIDVILIGSFVVVAAAIFEIYTAYLQASKQSKKVSLLNVGKSLVFLVLSVAITVLLSENKYLGKVYGQAIVFIGFSFYAAYSILKIVKLNIEYKYLKYSLFFGIPIAFHLMSQFVLGSFDQIIINQIVGSKETGLYAFAYQIGMIQSIISMALLKSWTPIFYEKMNKLEYKSIESLAKKYSLIVFALAIGLGLFAREIIIVFADESFYASLSIVPIVVLSYLFFFLYTMYVGYAFYSKKTVLIALFTVIAGAVNIYLNYLLIPVYGYTVAAWTTLLSYVVLFVLHYLNVRFIIKPDVIISLRVFLPNLLLVIGLISVYYFLLSDLDSYLLQLLGKIGLLSIGLLVLFKHQIIRILN